MHITKKRFPSLRSTPRGCRMVRSDAADRAAISGDGLPPCCPQATQPAPPNATKPPPPPPRPTAPPSPPPPPRPHSAHANARLRADARGCHGGVSPRAGDGSKRKPRRCRGFRIDWATSYVTRQRSISKHECIVGILNGRQFLCVH